MSEMWKCLPSQIVSSQGFLVVACERTIINTGSIRCMLPGCAHEGNTNVLFHHKFTTPLTPVASKYSLNLESMFCLGSPSILVPEQLHVHNTVRSQYQTQPSSVVKEEHNRNLNPISI